MRTLALALLMQVARQYSASNPQARAESFADKVVQYIGEHFDTATLKSTAEHFAYHLSPREYMEKQQAQGI